jgi:hypothetical protein
VPNKSDRLFFFLQPNHSPGTEGDAESSYIPLSSDAGIWQMLYLLEYLKQSDTTALYQKIVVHIGGSESEINY